MSSGVRVRFAPSPTGFFHIGSARTALFNWLYARHTGGTFVLRIEDTDHERDSDEFLQVIFDGLRWLGLNWDEGPEVGGSRGPYFQSKRDGVYREYLEILRKNGRAYDKEGAVFFKISGEPQVIHDAIHGDVVRKEEKDFVIFRSNGTPVFHFVNVVDDIAMGITHVIRGEDHLSNTSKHVELFHAFGSLEPVFAHIPLILKSQGSGKMSKRDSGALVENYAKQYFISDAVRNYLCLLGWSPKYDREILPIDEIITLFDICNVNKNNARFDEKKMSHMNAEYVRALPFNDFYERATKILNDFGVNFLTNGEAYAMDVLRICQEKLSSLREVPEFVKYFFTAAFDYDRKDIEKLRKKCNIGTRLDEFIKNLPSVNEFSEKSLEEYIHLLCEKYKTTPGEYIHSLRLALSGRSVGPGLYAMLCVFGREEVLRRIGRFLREV
ncbi:MAG: glutamate--tRNA ligase [Puniceicoccales bacterium]|jgi:glutamyl-tRNA synthetase|nr:glutamate--tRNA ligase [Puniceicoccales bacterium]